MLLRQLQRIRYDLSLLPGRQSTRQETGLIVVMMLQGVLSSTREERTLAILPRGGSARVSNIPAYRYSICAAFLETQILLTVSFLPQFTVCLFDLDLLNRC